MSTPPLSIVFVGGGTAGHVSPLLAMADAVRAINPDARITMIGTDQGLEAWLVPQAGYPLRTIRKATIPRRPTPQLAKVPGQLWKAVAEAEAVLVDVDADVVVGVGGYVSGPGYLAARRAGIPVIIHEANSRAGFTNRVAARWAARVATTFAATRIARGELIGMPVRAEVIEIDRRAERRAARERLGLAPDLPTLVVTGGSSGAQSINQAIAQVAPEAAEAGIQILHITGAGKAVRNQSGALLAAPGYRQVEYVDGMADAYAAADLLLARSGANTVAEVATVGVPAVFVPLPIGNGEQALNAQDVVDSGLAILIPDAELTASTIRSRILPLVKDSAALTRMESAALTLPHRGAAAAMAKIIVDTAKEDHDTHH